LSEGDGKIERKRRNGEETNSFEEKAGATASEEEKRRMKRSIKGVGGVTLTRETRSA